MSSLAKNQTNPVVLDATGYTPYILDRLERSAAQGGAEDSAIHRNDTAIRNYFIREGFYNEIENYSKGHDKDLFRSQWEGEADKKGLHSRVLWEMDKVYETRKVHLQHRRERLAELLRREDEMYCTDVVPPEPSQDSKRITMQQRLADIRMKKEQKRQEILKQKQDQHFRANSDDLRTLMSKRMNDKIFKEGMEQIKEKNRRNEEQNKVDEIYSEMWIRNAEEQTAKDKKDEQYQKEKNIEYRRSLKEQINENELIRKAILGTKEEEALLLAEQKRLVDLEIEYEQQQKKKKQLGFKKDLDRCLRDKLKQKAQDVQKELQIDLDFFNRLNGENFEDKAKKKHMLLKEQQQYLDYLAERIKKEAEFEKEIDAMYQKESEKIWEQKEKEWEYDKRKRQDLTKKTIQGCYEQIQTKLKMNRQVQKLKMQYGEQVQRQAAADIQEMGEKQKIIRENNRKYQHELLQQIKANEEAVQYRKSMELKETERFIKSQNEYEEKLRQILSDPNIEHLHPYHARSGNS